MAAGKKTKLMRKRFAKSRARPRTYLNYFQSKNMKFEVVQKQARHTS